MDIDIKVKDLYEHFNKIAPFHYQESYDNAGLIVGDINMKIQGVVICLDSTEAIVDEAISLGANVIVAHHPIIFSGLKKINGNNYIEKIIIKAIKNDIAIIAIHTNLDNILQNGVNQKIAMKLGLKELKILKPSNHYSNDEIIGAGIIGELEKPLSEESFTEFLKKNMELQVVKRTSYLNKNVKKIALCGGSGSFLLEDAIIHEADVFITADFKYHQFFDANDKLVIYDIGHYESEKYTIELIKDLIINKFSTFAAHCTRYNTNPVFYN
jgi:dinuclear metal center YbgI/SA1388 family protein